MSTATPLSLDNALWEANASYTARLPTCHSHFEKALEFMPGGNTRSVLFNAPFPIFMKKGSGNRLWDYDGNEYIDLVGELSAGLYGHSHPLLKQVLLSTYETVGVNLGATTTEEVRFAELLCKRFPAIEQLRFCNSGTEANIYALSIARRFTRKRKVICFGGSYHGGVLSFRHGIAPNAIDKYDWILGVYNNAAAVEELIESTSNVAAVIVEAMQGAGGCILATPEFMRAIQTTASKHGVIFILNEVMTSRLHPNGLQGEYSLQPDLTTLGKYLGGGLAFGAFGGRKDLLAVYNPQLPSSLLHSGTFNNNTLAMSCVYAGLAQIYTPTVTIEHNKLGDYLRSQLKAISENTKLVVTGIGAILTIHCLSTGKEPSNLAYIDRHDNPGLNILFWYWCLRNGFWVTERSMLSIVLGTKKEVDLFVSVVARFVGMYSTLVSIEV